MSLDDKPSGFRMYLPPMHRRLGAPLGGQTAHGVVAVFIKTQQVADDTAVEQSAVRVGIG